ncbi:hypothetical protein BEWA_033630 [Theileria equi strain WA]|uniref:Uncharacterized protein n=1 Tax=Theileria equi strain WA TaxID=1537102 RepID=L0AZ40_THEEQ|nr:hypothetical protein BEWA_033630 [Theileria equi strain WA]AFZ80508.1 hypothetical protein BEWA_033630 [Theileria equi strain WA]|eukprot:XP_004830174.1 hypothetical protein BEWA_033630 [Theileria equi strain WA]
MVSFEFGRSSTGLDNTKLTQVETKSSFSTDISVYNDNDTTNFKEKIDFNDCELGEASSDFSDSSAYEDLKDIDPSNFRLSPQHTISPKRDIDIIEDFQSIASPNSAERICSQDIDPSFNIGDPIDGLFLECEAVNQDESLIATEIGPHVEKITEDDLRMDTIDEDMTGGLHMDDSFMEYTNVTSSQIELSLVENSEELPEDNDTVGNVYSILCNTPLENHHNTSDSAPAFQECPMEQVQEEISELIQEKTESTLIRTDTDISAIVDINRNKEDYENTLKIYKELLGEKLISSTELNYETLDQNDISARLYHYISKVVSDSPTSHRASEEFKTSENNIVDEPVMDIVVEPEMLDPKASETIDSSFTSTDESTDNKNNIYYLKGDNMESIPFPNVSDDTRNNPTFRSAEENMEISRDSSRSGEEEWDMSLGMISTNSANLVNGSLRSIKVVVGSNLFNANGSVLQNNMSLNSGYSPVYDETKKLMQNITEKLKKINYLKKKFNEICFKNANEATVIERNRLSYCLLASNTSKLASVIAQYKQLIELQNKTIASKRNNTVKMRKTVVESMSKRQLFKKIQPKIEFLESLKYNLASIHKSTGITIIPIIDRNSFLKTIFSLSFNDKSDMRFLSDTCNTPWLNETILKVKRAQKLLSINNEDSSGTNIGVNAVIFIKTPNHTASKNSSIDSFHNTRSSSSKFLYSGPLTEGSHVTSHRTLIDHSPYPIPKRSFNDDIIHSIITPKNKNNNIHENNETIGSVQTGKPIDVTEELLVEYFIPKELNWDETIDILRLKHDLRVVLYALKSNNRYGLNVWHEFNSVLLNTFNKFLKNTTDAFLGKLEQNPNLFQLINHLVRITSNIAARIRIISRELCQWISITNTHSFQYNGTEFRIRSMLSSEESKPCLWCDFGINMNNICAKKTILESINEIKVQFVHNRYKGTIVDDINRSLKSSTKHNHGDLCTFIKNICKLNGYTIVSSKK